MSAEAMRDRLIRGRVWKYGDDVDTDVIFPGRHTYTARGPEEIASHALEDLDPSFAAGVKPGDVVVGGRNWGCGSSREQAVTCLVHSGVRAVIAVSFGRIFFRNAVNQGLWALTVSPEAVDALGAEDRRPGEAIEIDLDRGVIRAGERDVPFHAPDPRLRRIVEAGGLIPYVTATLPEEPADLGHVAERPLKE